MDGASSKSVKSYVDKNNMSDICEASSSYPDIFQDYKELMGKLEAENQGLKTSNADLVSQVAGLKNELSTQTYQHEKDIQDTIIKLRVEKEEEVEALRRQYEE